MSIGKAWHGYDIIGVVETTSWKEKTMTLVVDYPSKKALKESVGKPLQYIETSLFGPEYHDNGTLTVAGRPHITGQKREFFARVNMVDGKITKVS